jgi:hypothetical protein
MRLRYTAAGREQRDIDARKIEFSKILDLEPPVSAPNGLANRPGAGKRMQVAYRELAFSQNLQHRLSDEAGSANHCNVILTFHY